MDQASIDISKQQHYHQPWMCLSIHSKHSSVCVSYYKPSPCDVDDTIATMPLKQHRQQQRPHSTDSLCWQIMYRNLDCYHLSIHYNCSVIFQNMSTGGTNVTLSLKQDSLLLQTLHTPLNMCSNVQ